MTELNIKEGMIIVDSFGKVSPLTPYTVHVVLGAGWACFIASWLVNILHYIFHPSSVNLNPSRKKILYVFGQDVFAWKTQSLTVLEGKILEYEKSRYNIQHLS